MALLLDYLNAGQPSRMGMIEGDPEYDPWSMQAARYRARQPTRYAGIGATDASRPAGFAGSGVGFSDLPGYNEAKQQSMLVARRSRARASHTPITSRT